MHSWFKTHSKKIMAILGAALMVTFLIQSPMNSLSGRAQGRGSPIAHMGKLALYADEKAAASKEWELIDRSYSESQGRFGPMTRELGNAIAYQINEHPELFLILAKEAQQRGIEISDDIVGTVVQNRIMDALSNDNFTRYLENELYREAMRRGMKVNADFLGEMVQSRLINLAGTARDPLFKEAVKKFLMIVALRDQLNSNVKVSEPQWNHESADAFRSLRLNLAEFSAPQMATKAPAPTTQQVTEFFDKYRDVPPAAAQSTKDSLNFGYQVPNRVKVQYVTIPRDQVLKAARAARDSRPYKEDEPTLDVMARMYYQEHQSEFMRPAERTPATQPAVPATQASTQSTTQPSGLAAATQATTQPAIAATTEPSGPTTRPFAEVQDQIVSTILKKDVDDLTDKVAEAVRDKMSADWQTFQAAHPDYHPATAPTTGPSELAGPTTQPTGFDSYAYLDEVRADIQKQFKVSIEINQPAGWKTIVDLSNLNGIGESSTGTDSFPVYAAKKSAPFIDEPALQASALKLLQPSTALKDARENEYIFRLTDASPAHAPDLAEVMARVQEDAKIKAAYEQANTAAAKLLDAAKKDGFAKAALAAGVPIISTGKFNMMNVSYSKSIPNFQHSEEAVQAIVEKASELANQATEQNPHPLGLVQIPGERMVVVVELGDVSTPPPAELGFFMARQLAQEEAMAVEPISESYFSYDAVVKRVDYKVSDKNKD